MIPPRISYPAIFNAQTNMGGIVSITALSKFDLSITLLKPGTLSALPDLTV
jgi:hypothetical protein